MTFTYAGDPSASQSDAVRFLVGDTDEDEYFLEDEEISWLISLWLPKGSIFYPASMAAEAIASKLTREVTTSSDNQSLSLSELQQKYMSLAVSLRDQHKDLLTGGSVYAGGMDAGEQADLTVVPLAFGTRMHDNREAGRQDYGDAGDFPEFGTWGEYRT